jgi:hypothetical protein
MRKFPVLILFACIFLLSGCEDEKKLHSRKNFEKLYWLEGNWKGKMNNGIYYESWKKESPDMLSGTSFYIEGQDTIMSEKANIKRGFTGVFYNVKVGNEEEFDFQLVEITDALSIYENQLHDFPQRIIYIKKNNDNLLVRIEGTMQQKNVSKEFRLQRQK